VLRANEEEECKVAADAYRATFGCLASLDCDDLADEFTGADKCEDQVDDYNDAIEDADGECQGACSAAPAAEFAGALVLMLALRRRRR
jgi:hypothetical protein